MSIPLAMGVKDAAAALSLSPWTIRKYIAKGVIPYIRIGRRVLIEATEVERLIQQGRVRGGTIAMAQNYEIWKIGWAKFAGGEWKQVKNPETGELIGFEAVGTNCSLIITDNPSEIGISVLDVPTCGTVVIKDGLAMAPRGEDRVLP